ncbi:MAG: contractile injection system protein, VgrG/Pvc8 family [Nostocales cyanobacterium 94392]|nr:contractile injection system protein, VgrG/Pvc8 family [Nostocales cyanobacterium 94392]
MTVSTEFQSREIYRNRDLYVPTFDIKINGESLPDYAGKDVIDVRYSDNTDQIDSFEITVNNWDAGRQDFKYTGSTKDTTTERNRLFDPGQKIEIWMGYFNPARGEDMGLQLMLVGLITKITPIFPASGQSTLKVSGQNALRELMVRQNSRIYTNKRDSEIAEEVGRRGNFRIGNLEIPIRVDNNARSQEPVNEHVFQNNQFDIVFLLQRAHRNGYNLLLRQGNGVRLPRQYLFFGPIGQERRISYILEWGKSLIQFQPTLTTSRQVYSVTVNAWDASRGRRITVTVDRTQLPTRGLRDRRELDRIEEGFRERSEVIVDRPFRNQGEARQYALARLEENARDLVTGNGSTIGTPDLRAGSIIQIQKLGSIFDGRYVVKSTTHTINASGYITEFAARLEEENQ